MPVWGCWKKVELSRDGARSQARDDRFSVRLAYVEESCLKTQNKQMTAKMKTKQNKIPPGVSWEVCRSLRGALGEDSGPQMLAPSSILFSPVHELSTCSLPSTPIIMF